MFVDQCYLFLGYLLVGQCYMFIGYMFIGYLFVGPSCFASNSQVSAISRRCPKSSGLTASFASLRHSSARCVQSVAVRTEASLGHESKSGGISQWSHVTYPRVLDSPPANRRAVFKRLGWREAAGGK